MQIVLLVGALWRIWRGFLMLTVYESQIANFIIHLLSNLYDCCMIVRREYKYQPMNIHWPPAHTRAHKSHRGQNATKLSNCGENYTYIVTNIWSKSKSMAPADITSKMHLSCIASCSYLAVDFIKEGVSINNVIACISSTFKKFGKSRRAFS